ncbi:metallophosphoesterase [Sporosarcina sp. NCCP-2222]|uniref:metallophosphoesterase n=1 Tax=Sporosarcina sp. NCCP-2222 TaxID=2935073 RepID=UPI0020BDC0A9|nr:metallophosphoesterase [Sporosarcina sp. NCCP-2222]
MKIIVLSDTHGDLETVQAVSAMPADAIFHCGDSELTLDAAVWKTMRTVKGNCDRERQFPDQVVQRVGNKQILVVHGHQHDCNRSLLPLYYEALEQKADIVLFGHTHLYGAEMKDDILFLNPGSPVLPRRGKEPTYAIIEWEQDATVSFVNPHNELVDTLQIKNF